MSMTEQTKPRGSTSAFVGRHTIFEPGSQTPYMTRIWIGRLRLHIFYRGDLDPDCHDHPWDFWTFPLTPYVEEVVENSGWMEYEINGSRHSYLADSDEARFSPLAAELGKPIFRKHLQIVPAWRLTFRPATHCHRVLGAYAGQRRLGSDTVRLGAPMVDKGRKIITIVWRSDVYRSWGFLKSREGQWCWVAWKDYVFGGGKDAPCSPDEEKR